MSPRVLFLIQRYRPTFSGMAVQIERVAARLRQRGVEAAVVTDRTSEAPEHEPGADPPVFRFPFPVTRNPLELWWRSRPLRAFLSGRRSEFDVLHVQGAPAVFPLVLPAARRLGWRTAVTSTLLDSDDPATVGGRGRMGRWRLGAYREADGFLAISPALLDAYPPAGIPRERVSMIPPGVDTDRFVPADDRDAAARDLGWEDGPRAVFVGAVIRRKGVDVLLDAWERVVREHPRAVLHVVGPTTFGSGQDPAFNRFAADAVTRAESGPLAGRVRFHGMVGDPDHLARMLAAAQVFVFPSRMEGFGIVIAEALAAGTPAVVARIPGITDDNVRHGETGFVVEQEDAGGVAEAVGAVFADPATGERLGRAARADALARFSLDSVTDRYLGFYKGLLP